MTATIIIYIAGLVILIAGADLLARGERRLSVAMIEVDERATSGSKDDQA